MSDEPKQSPPADEPQAPAPPSDSKGTLAGGKPLRPPPRKPADDS